MPVDPAGDIEWLLQKLRNTHKNAKAADLDATFLLDTVLESIETAVNAFKPGTIT